MRTTTNKHPIVTATLLALGCAVTLILTFSNNSRNRIPDTIDTAWVRNFFEFWFCPPAPDSQASFRRLTISINNNLHLNDSITNKLHEQLNSKGKPTSWELSGDDLRAICESKNGLEVISTAEKLHFPLPSQISITDEGIVIMSMNFNEDDSSIELQIPGRPDCIVSGGHKLISTVHGIISDQARQ